MRAAKCHHRTEAQRRAEIQRLAAQCVGVMVPRMNQVLSAARDRGVTIISATHDLKMIDVSDRVVWIRDGHLERIEERSEIQLNVGQMEGEEA